MTYRETLTLKSNKPIEAELLKELDDRLQRRGIDVYILDVDAYCLEMCQKLIMEKGSRYILSLERLQEAVLIKASNIEDRDLLIKVLSSYLQALSPSKDLIIVDSYFFPTNLSNRNEYIDIFKAIIGPIIPNIATLKFITKSEYDEELYNDIKSVLIDLSPIINVTHEITNEFHDRFWIADEVNGLFIGTSLNGIGRKYALVDFIRDEDTKIIVKVLKQAGLI
jgi:hypothetical protein